MICQRCRSFILLAFLSCTLGCGGERSGKQGSTAQSPPNPKAAGRNPPDVHTELTDTDKAEEKRRTISISKNRMTIKGIPVQLGRTTRQELEKIIGPPDHVVEIGRPICIWDKAGFRGYFSPKSEWLDYFDCIFVVESDLETEPENTFAGEFALERTLISKATTKQSLQGKLSQPMRDHSFDLPGFSVDYPHVSISFEPTRDAKGLASVRFAAPLSKGPGR